MRLFLFLLLLSAGAPRVEAAVVRAAAGEVPLIILPGAPFGQSTAPELILPSQPALSISAPPSLILPSAPVILAPPPVVVSAVRPLTELEASPAKMLSPGELKRLADSLAPPKDGADAGPSDADRARSLGAAFDGALAPEAAGWSDVSGSFAGPLAPGLPVVDAAARSLIARLLPDLYRRVPALAAYDRSENPATGHTWTPERGHVIEIAPVSPDSRGDVPSSFGAPGRLRVQQKIERLMEYAHEYFHVVFDSGVRRKENHPVYSAYAALTEGFAVGGEQLLIERMLDAAPALGLGARDVMNLAAISSARREWLDTEDSHYSEGIISWRKAYEEGGVKGMASFLAGLSARRMIDVPRSDPAYQLALGDPALLSAYLGRDEASPVRRGFEAFAKAARGEALDVEETRDAAAAVELAGPDGWRRLFDRTLLADKRIKIPRAADAAKKWFEADAEPEPSVEPVFALARLSPAAGAALARYLADAVSTRGGAARLFGRPGPGEKFNALVSGAESLPWDADGKKAWDEGVMRRLMGAN